MSEYFDVAIATIFAREILEASIIIGQYRTVILRSEDWQGENETKALKTVTKSALWASFVAIVICVAVAIPLGVFSQDLDENAVLIIEAVSKIVGAVCVLQLSLKIPTWLELYVRKKGDVEVGLTLREIRFNVSWNIWREVAECGVFLIPFFLGKGAKAIPLSAVVGSVISLILGFGIYFGNRKLKNKFWLAFFMSALTGALSIGLFVGGCHLFELVLGMTNIVWTIQNDFWSHENFPMTIFKPFGYTSYRTVLQIVCFWTWTALLLGFHFRKYYFSKKRFTEVEEEEKSGIEKTQQCEQPSTYVSSDSDIEMPEQRFQSEPYSETNQHHY